MNKKSFSQFEQRLIEFMTRASTPVAPENFEVESQRAFQELALDLFALQFETVPAYERFCQSRKISPANVGDWRRIPAVPTAAFKEFEWSSLPPSERTHEFHSSGTTGQVPSRHFHDADSLRTYEASLLHWFRRSLLADFFPDATGATAESGGKLQFIFLTPTAEAAPHSSLVHMFDAIARENGGGDAVFAGQTGNDGWNLKTDVLLAHLHRAMEANRPVALLGTAFLFVHLLDYCAANKIIFRLARGSRVLETGGYKGRSREVPRRELHRLLTKHLGVTQTHIVGEYGMSELSSQAYDREIKNAKLEMKNVKNEGAEARVYRFPAWARAQIISPETGEEVNDGETGLVRIFDLGNVRSVLAIQTDDLAIRRGEGFELLGRARLSEPRGCSLMTP